MWPTAFAQRLSLKNQFGWGKQMNNEQVFVWRKKCVLHFFIPLPPALLFSIFQSYCKWNKILAKKKIANNLRKPFCLAHYFDLNHHARECFYRWNNAEISPNDMHYAYDSHRKKTIKNITIELCVYVGVVLAHDHIRTELMTCERTHSRTHSPAILNGKNSFYGRCKWQLIVTCKRTIKKIYDIYFMVTKLCLFLEWHYSDEFQEVRLRGAHSGMRIQYLS